MQRGRQAGRRTNRYKHKMDRWKVTHTRLTVRQTDRYTDAHTHRRTDSVRHTPNRHTVTFPSFLVC
jgi:hypothetical protein